MIHGQASSVIACEWNPDAVLALRYNLQDNRVSDKVHVLEGDSRQTARDYCQQTGASFDRISLGLLPSSEGGWGTAIGALGVADGGWLHIHGNVPVTEVQAWSIWVSRQLSTICQASNRPADWIVLVEHVERVKSFAPTVSHYVADTFVGSIERHSRTRPEPTRTIHDPALLKPAFVGVLQSDGTLLVAPIQVSVPSCALSEDGALSQEWMK